MHVIFFLSEFLHQTILSFFSKKINMLWIIRGLKQSYQYSNWGIGNIMWPWGIGNVMQPTRESLCVASFEQVGGAKKNILASLQSRRVFVHSIWWSWLQMGHDEKCHCSKHFNGSWQQSSKSSQALYKGSVIALYYF